ncbi:MAG: phage portal protein, partial [Thermoguttaceae bacterium]
KKLNLPQKELQFSNKHPPLVLRLKYDAAQTTSENARHWSMADALSADGSMTPEIRRILRNRARYEVANNSYAKGLAVTISTDCIGTGPRLQILSDNDKFNSIVEAEFTAWSEAARLGEKLQTMRMSKITDGEAFAAILKNPRINHPVEIDIRPIEADRITSPYPSLQREMDGVEYDQFGNPIRYHIATEHPGDTSLWHGTFETIAAEYMIHWYRPDRPGQSRGIPEITPALPLFAQLRRYTLAVLAAAETAADFAAVLYTDSPANGEAQPLEPLDIVALEKRMATVMPDGWKLGQIRAEQPNTTYAEFKREILGEIGRCMLVPVNILIGDSSKHNYASGRLDHQGYYRNINVEQKLCEQVVLFPIFDAWYREACRLRLFTPPKRGFPLNRTGNQVKGGTVRTSICGEAACFFWDGVEHVDPIKEAKAVATRIDSRVSNLAIECAKYGRDWEDVLTQAAKEEKLIQTLGLEKKPLPKLQPTKRRKKSDEESQTDEPDIRGESDQVRRRRKRRDESGGEW